MNNNNNELKILIAGEGGQGVQSLGKIISDACFEKKLQVTFIPNYGVEQRGGVTIAFIKIRKKEPIVYPKFSIADILVWLSNRSVNRTKQYAGGNTLVIYNKSYINNISNKKYLGINFDQLGNEIGSNRVINMLVLGVLLNPKLKNGLSQWLDFNQLKNSLNKKFEKSYKNNPGLKELNEKALLKGANINL